MCVSFELDEMPGWNLHCFVKGFDLTWNIDHKMVDASRSRGDQMYMRRLQCSIVQSKIINHCSSCHASLAFTLLLLVYSAHFLLPQQQSKECPLPLSPQQPNSLSSDFSFKKPV